MVSLQVYDAEYVGEMDNWAATANRMVARGLRLLEAYGMLIANTDRHYGNISLLLADDDWTLSPTYDMLPSTFWQTAAADARVSDGFRAIAADNLRLIGR